MGAGGVADQHHLAEGEFEIFRVVDGGEVEIESTVLRVEDLDIA